jgi:hypothetical protein
MSTNKCDNDSTKQTIILDFFEFEAQFAHDQSNVNNLTAEQEKRQSYYKKFTTIQRLNAAIRAYYKQFEQSKQQ